MAGAAHLLKNVFGDLELVTIGVYCCYRLAFYFLDAKIRYLRKILAGRKFAGFPQWLSCPFGSSGTSTSTEGRADHERSSFDKFLGHFGLAQIFACVREISDIQDHSACFVDTFQNFNHLVALFVDSYDCEINGFGCEVFHLVLNYEPIWGSSGEVVNVALVDVFSVSGGVANQECLFNGISRPVLFQSVIQSTL